MLKRRKPLKARQRVLKRSPLRRVSKPLQARLRRYYGAAKAFLARPENQRCRICGCCPAAEVHHIRGRAGALLMDERYWAPLCRACRMFPHEHPKWARDLGLLAPAHLWNVSDKT